MLWKHWLIFDFDDYTIIKVYTKGMLKKKKKERVSRKVANNSEDVKQKQINGFDKHLLA